MIEFANDVTPTKSKLKFPFSTLGLASFRDNLTPLWSTIRRTLDRGDAEVNYGGEGTFRDAFLNAACIKLHGLTLDISTWTL